MKAYSQTDDFLERPVLGNSTDATAERPGTLIGRDRLLEPIGEGGFGIVDVAEQQQPVPSTESDSDSDRVQPPNPDFPYCLSE